MCEYLPDVSTYCRSMGSISVAVSAASELGAGSRSDPVFIGKSSYNTSGISELNLMATFVFNQGFLPQNSGPNI